MTEPELISNDCLCSNIIHLGWSLFMGGGTSYIGVTVMIRGAGVTKIYTT